MKIDKLQRYLLASVLLTPLLPASSLFLFPYVIPKVVFYRSLILLSGVLAVARIRFVAGRLTLSTFEWTALLLFTSQIVAAFAGVDPSRSLWDGSERSMGLITLGHLLLFGLLLTWSLTRREWMELARTLLLVGIFVTGWPVGEKIFSLLTSGTLSPTRPSGTLGHPVFLAGFSLGMIFIGGFLLANSKGLYRFITTLAIVLGCLSLIFSETRGSSLAFFAGIAAVAICNRWYRTLWLHRRLSAGIGLIILSLLGLVTTGYLDMLGHFPLLRRFETGLLDSGTGHMRATVWASGLSAWSVRPVWGWGPENSLFATSQSFSPELLQYLPKDHWWDELHNACLSALVETGLVGLLAFLLFLVAVGRKVYRQIDTSNSNLRGTSYLAGFLVAHLVHLCFAFEDHSGFLLLVFVLAFFNLGDGSSRGIRLAEQVRAPKVAISLGIGCLAVAFLNGPLLSRSFETLSAIEALATGDETAPALEAPRWTLPCVSSVDFDRSYCDSVLKHLTGNGAQSTPERIDYLISACEARLNAATRCQSLDPRLPILGAQIATRRYLLLGDVSGVVSSIAQLQEAVQRYPDLIPLYVSIANLLYFQGMPQEGVGVLKEVLRRAPKAEEGYWRTAYLYLKMGDDESAKQTVLLGRRNGVEYSTQAKRALETAGLEDNVFP